MTPGMRMKGRPMTVLRAPTTKAPSEEREIMNRAAAQAAVPPRISSAPMGEAAEGQAEGLPPVRVAAPSCTRNQARGNRTTATSTPAQWVSTREPGALSTLAPLRRMESSSSSAPVMAMAACRARERPRSSGSSLCPASALADSPRAAGAAANQSGVCCGEGADGEAAGVGR